MASISETGQVHAHNPAMRGYHVVYREREPNYCPGCGRTHWYVGRTMAECAFCGTAMPLESSTAIGHAMIVQTRQRPAIGTQDHAFAA